MTCLLSNYVTNYVSLVLTYLLVLAEVAGKLGYDEIDDVTTEDMVLEVRSARFADMFENQMKSSAKPFRIVSSCVKCRFSRR